MKLKQLHEDKGKDFCTVLKKSTTDFVRARTSFVFQAPEEFKSTLANTDSSFVKLEILKLL